MELNLGLLITALTYLGVLFGIAYYADWQRTQSRSLINNATIYSLSLAVYCTGWTFYGSVGLASKQGVMFLPVYLGPTLLALLWVFVLRKIIRICKRYSLTSIADFVSSRYGKSPFLGGLVAVIAVVGILPYIALQLKVIGTSFQLIIRPTDLQVEGLPLMTRDATFYITLVLIAFTILFGVRRLDTSERHEGMVAAVAFESLVKLVAFLSVGLFVVFGLYDGFGDLFTQAGAVPELEQLVTPSGDGSFYEDWFLLGALSMLAFLLLPRQFQVSVVENVNEDHISRAAWLFPLYLLLINLFVLPIALAGRLYFAEGTIDADTFVLTLPMAMGNESLAWFVFIGGLSAATSMIIVEAVALSNMICNSLVMPILIRLHILHTEGRPKLDRVVLNIRRGSVALVLFASYLYFRQVIGPAHSSLVSIGLVSFLAVAQFAPSVIGGLYWKNGTRLGAVTGLLAGFVVWGYTLPFSQLINAGLLPSSILSEGLFGLSWLRPLHLFGLEAMTPISQATFWSLLINTGCYVGVSMITRQTALERGQANLFVDAFRYGRDSSHAQLWRGSATSEELRTLLQRFLGNRRTDQVLREFAHSRGLNPEEIWQADSDLIQYTEKLLSGAIGSVSARIMVASVAKEEPLRVDEVMDLLDATQQAIAYSQQLEEKSQQLQTATAELRKANLRLQELDALKDEFISTITHELRTPLTSIRAFSEILYDARNLPKAKQKEFLSIVIQESERLTRLINQILDIEKMELGKLEWNKEPVVLQSVIHQALASVSQLVKDRRIAVETDLAPGALRVFGDPDRLTQVLVNLLSNAIKFSPEKGGGIWVTALSKQDQVVVRVRDNGIGIPSEYWESVFEKFKQYQDQEEERPSGTGLGLSISKTIIENHQGRMYVAPGSESGAILEFVLPLWSKTSQPEVDARPPQKVVAA